MITRADFDIITSWVPDNARVLDLGCGDGSLLAHLARDKQTTGYGIENDNASLLACIDTVSYTHLTLPTIYSV